MITGIYQSFMMLLGVIPFYMTDTYFHHKYDPKRKEIESGRNWWIVGGSAIIAFILLNMWTRKDEAILSQALRIRENGRYGEPKEWL